MIVEKVCPTCQETFQYDASLYGRGRKFCSRICANRANYNGIEARQCPQCKRTFQCGKTKTKTYCSPQCAYKGSRAKQKKVYPIKTCVACGKEFEHKRHDIGGKYCSRDCSDKADKSAPRRLPRIKKICIYCGKEFERAPYHETDCCSRLCSNRHTALTQVGENHPLHKPKIEMKCEVCGKICYVKPSIVSRFRSCSRRCNAYLTQISAPRTSSLETKVLEALRLRGFNPVHQYPMPPYTIDVALPDAMIAIECDGDYWHSSERQKTKDKARDTFLTRRGWQVIRLKEYEIKANLDGCIDRVIALLTPAK
jgi:very-short-patch-repair endonuclease